MYFDISFKKSILMIYRNFKDSNIPIDKFIDSIEISFGISKSTFYNWLHDPIIYSHKLNVKYNNNLITPAVEQIILSNNKLNIKSIKKKLQNLNINLNKNSIRYVLFKNNTNNPNPNNNQEIISKITQKQLKNNFIVLTEDNEQFITEHKGNIKDIINDLNIKFNINIHEKQIVNVMYKHKKYIKSFFKITPIIEDFIVKKINEKCIFTSVELQNFVFNEFKTKISIQAIYLILKKYDYVFKKIRKVNNPYTIPQQVEQLEKVKKIHNLKNIDNCISLDEISVLENAIPEYGWFKKNSIPNYKIDNPKIISKRYTILMASTNKKPLFALICEKGMNATNFIYFMNKVIKMVNKKCYFLMDNASTHKSKLFKQFIKDNKLKVVYNAPYHSEFNPIENVFWLFRNKLNRNETKNIDQIVKITENFMLENNETKLKNIFDNSVKLIDNFIKENKK